MNIDTGLYITVDPGLTGCGWCLLNPFARKIIKAAGFKPKGDRRLCVAMTFRNLFLSYKPAFVIVETPFSDERKAFLFHKGGVAAALSVGKGAEVSGIVYGLAIGLGIQANYISVFDWNPNRRNKKDGGIRWDMCKKYGFPDDKSEHVYDAIGIADWTIQNYWQTQKIKVNNLLKR